MKGDFSIWQQDHDNVCGVLHQQGRVLLDEDGNAQTRITTRWQDRTVCQVVGEKVAAVSSQHPHSLKTLEANVVNGRVVLKANPGDVWVEGVHVNLAPNANNPASAVSRAATYFGPRIQTAPASPTSIKKGTRDAVVLEVWRESLNAFQDPEHLLETALGGPDTTERLLTSMRLRLLRLSPGQHCEDIVDQLSDDAAVKGRLRASLHQAQPAAGDCPVEESGGYIGFEHSLYRLEIARVNVNQTMFKWSQFNGGLVGRGLCDLAGAQKKITLRGNDQAIKMSGLSDFYLEIVEEDPAERFLRVTYGAEVTLNGDELQVINERYTEAQRPTGTVFFRLWNGIRRIADFPKVPSPTNGTPLDNNTGILLEFDAQSAGKYVPGDYWTFNVRAGGLANPNRLIDDEPPQGVRYHRAPIAELEWHAGPGVAINAPDHIEDCRHEFPPLTDLRGCCKEIKPGQDIHRALRDVVRAGGGCLCLLPGDHHLVRPIDLTGMSSIQFRGFGPASRLHVSPALLGQSPFLIGRSADISFDGFAIRSPFQALIWTCDTTHRLAVRDMFVHASLRRLDEAIISVRGKGCRDWQIEHNIFLGANGINGTALIDCTIAGNLFLGVNKGIDLRDMYKVSLVDNDFAGVASADIKTVDVPTVNVADFVSHRAEALRFSKMLVATGGTVANRGHFDGVDLAGAFETRIERNRFIGRIGFTSEAVEDCTLLANYFLTGLYGADMGAARGVRFIDNRIGVKQSNAKTPFPQVGLRFIGDAIDCRIIRNAFRNVEEGIVFESDLRLHREMIRDFTAITIPNAANLNSARRAANFELVKARADFRFSKRRLFNSSFFRIGKCARTLIQHNLIQARKHAVDWSGTKDIVDFKISDNSFLDCQDTAISIEPESRIYFIADPVDTKVRLIEKNRFDVFSAAVRATIGAVRVEKNDIRVKAPVFTLIPPKVIVGTIAPSVFSSPEMTAAADKSDVPMMRVMMNVVTSAANENPNSANTAKFINDVENNILTKNKPGQGNVYADTMFTMKNLADLGVNNMLVSAGTNVLARIPTLIERFAVNLGGIQNTVVGNNIYSDHERIGGGVILDLLSGSVSDNQIKVSRTGLQMNGKTAQKGQNVVISSNVVEVSGSSASAGKTKAAYALAIPQLEAGNVSINSNQFEGSVMIGAEPFASLGLNKNNNIAWHPGVVMYHALKLDPIAMSVSFDAQKIPQNVAENAVVDPNVVIATLPPIVAQLWMIDPNANRPVIQFADNRVVRGWVAIAQSTAGTFWSRQQLGSSNSAIVNVTGNVFDYWARVAGRDVVVAANQSQIAIQYRIATGRPAAISANIPDAVPF